MKVYFALSMWTSVANAFVLQPPANHLSITRHFNNKCSTLPHSRLNMLASSNEPQLTRLDNSAVQITIPVPGSATQAAYDKVCREVSKNINIPGFRKGAKIPPQVLEQAIGDRLAIKVQAINELVNTLVEPTLKQQKAEPIGQPTLVVPATTLAETFVPGQELVLQVQCDVWPDIQWKNEEKPYIGLTGSYQRKPFNQAKMDQALNDLKERYAKLTPIDTSSDYTLQMGDACTVNMVGYMATSDGEKGEPLPNAASGDNVDVVLGPGRYMEGLVEGLVGGKVGETKTVKVSFPEKLRDKTLAGKQAIFDVEIVQASKRDIPDITDDFANQVRAGLTADSLMTELRKAIDEEDKKEFTPARNKALGLALAQVMDVDVPDTLVTNQAREKFAVMMAEMRDNGVSDEEIKRQINPENFQKYKDIVKDDIIRDFKVSMATDEIARLEGITVPDFQIEEQMEAIRKDAAQSSEEFDEKMIRAKVETTMARQAVMDWLAEKANLDVKYEGENDEEFDEELLEKLAEESLERERKMTGSVVDVTSEPVSEKSEPVIEKSKAVAEKSEPVVEETVTEAKEVSQSSETDEDKQKRYANMSLQERAFQILKDTGAV